MIIWYQSSDWASSGKRRSRDCLYADIPTIQYISSPIKFFSHSYRLSEKYPRFLHQLVVDYLRYCFFLEFVQFFSLSLSQRNNLERLDWSVNDLPTWLVSSRSPALTTFLILYLSLCCCALLSEEDSDFLSNFFVPHLFCSQLMMDHREASASVDIRHIYRYWSLIWFQDFPSFYIHWSG